MTWQRLADVARPLIKQLHEATENNVMPVHTAPSLRRAHRRLDRRTAAQQRRRLTATRILEKLKAGAVLCRHHHRGRIIWCLVWKGGSEFLTHESVSDALASGNIVGVGDTLFKDAPSQTYRYVE